MVEIEALQLVVGYFGGKALEKLWYQMLFILTSINRVLWKSNVIYAFMTNRLVCSMLPGLTFIYFNQLIIDVEMSGVVHTGMEVHRMDSEMSGLVEQPWLQLMCCTICLLYGCNFR